jgi:hypothetical protein
MFSFTDNRKRQTILGIALVIVLTVVVGCGAAAMNGSTGGAPAEALYAEPPAPSGASVSGSVAPADTLLTDGDMALGLLTEDDIRAGEDTPQQQERVILRDATVRIIVEDTNMTIADITAMTEGMGGWVVNASSNANTSSGGTYTTGNITVRVPAEQLDEVLATNP